MKNQSLRKIPESKIIKSIAFYTTHKNDPCAFVRFRGPMNHLNINVLEGFIDEKINTDQILTSDLVVIQRDFPRKLNLYKKIIKLAHMNKKAIVFEIDDLLFQLPENHPDRQNLHYVESLLPIMQAIMEADLVTVATPLLKEIFSELNKNIVVIPNYFDDNLWSLTPPVIKTDDSHPLIIGYMGGESHIPDIQFITPVLKYLINRFPNEIEVHIWGVSPTKELDNYSQVKWIPAITYEYNEFAAYFQTQLADIFIAPLVDNSFNRAKSPLKFFEYSSLGVPGVFSNLNAYEGTVTHGFDGLLASTQEEWINNLVQLIQNKEMRFQIATNAQRTINSNWRLSENAYRWQEAYELILSKKIDNNSLEKTNIDLFRSLSNQYYELSENKKTESVNQQKEINELNTTVQQYLGLLENKETTLQKNRLEIQELKNEIHDKKLEIQFLTFELTEIKGSKTYKISLLLRKIRVYLIPPNSKRSKIASFIFHWLQGQRMKVFSIKQKKMFVSLFDEGSQKLNCPIIEKHGVPIDVIICVHNALEDIQKCLESITKYTTIPYHLIIVDDGSDEPTRNFLNFFATENQNCELIRNETAKGYTLAANIGMRASKASFLVLLNSDTIVGSQWIDRMYGAMIEKKKIGVVGPISNTASWQSIPKLSENGDWAINELPPNIDPSKMSELISKYSGCIHPEVPLLNGFCMMISKELINEIGYFDEDNFGQGYGEEDDFNLRASAANWKKVIADDVYIFHAQSKSYSNERRYNLSKSSGLKLRTKHSVNLIEDCVEFMNPNRVLEGIRSRSKIMAEREEYLEQGRKDFAGKKLLFVLPVVDAGGGANVIIDESRNMLQMGVDVRIFNLEKYKAGFLQSYPNIDVPLIFGDENELYKISDSFDAIVASANYSVEWLLPLKSMQNPPICGYYIQGFEPLMYPDDSEQARQALSTYIMIEGMKRFTKTEWTRNMVLEHAGVNSDVVGISINIDLFRPRHMSLLGRKPVRIVAMVRPNSPYRNPDMTIGILKQISEKYKRNVEIWFFGANDINDVVHSRLLDFEWKQLGKLTQHQVASLMSKADIFTDFSSHQAMGLTALEAMSAGCSVIVPKNGGAVEFIRDKENGIIADTSSFQLSLNALKELVEDDNLRKKIQIAGINDVVNYYPEKVSYKILKSIFEEN